MNPLCVLFLSVSQWYSLIFVSSLPSVLSLRLGSQEASNAINVWAKMGQDGPNSIMEKPFRVRASLENDNVCLHLCACEGLYFIQTMGFVKPD